MANILRLVLFITTVGIVIYFSASHFLSHKINTVDNSKIIKCTKIGDRKIISISESGFEPKKVIIKTCDNLIFKNTGKKYHQPAFGEHPDHLLYPGFIEQAMKPGTTNTVIVTAFGNYLIHDHIYDELQGEIDVER